MLRDLLIIGTLASGLVPWGSGSEAPEPAPTGRANPTPVAVVIRELGPEAARVGLTKPSLEMEVRRYLEESGYQVLNLSRALRTPGSLVFEVRVEVEFEGDGRVRVTTFTKRLPLRGKSIGFAPSHPYKVA